ncbi:hypothetical protein OBP_041 [Pseudomonas phage OBP]|uniref:hypothetical protein n=1 Tax=Pseudomonas phage OBP TaxID=1124849 RepID=UPI000240D626|nr:hypothetical protein OBP_041 [Pseudomonas phage OBP]AEV89478.1 hypothetical protein OBP_041 [Pseudomonas phage OBP]
MSRFKTELDTVKRTITITGDENDGTLVIRQQCYPGYFDNESECDRLVEYANDLQGDLNEGRIALQLVGENSIVFTDNNFPVMDSGIYLKSSDLSNPRLSNVHLTFFDAVCSEECIVTNSTISDFEWPHGNKIHLSHCFINQKYNEVTSRMSYSLNEWHLNQRVDGEMW